MLWHKKKKKKKKGKWKIENGRGKSYKMRRGPFFFFSFPFHFSKPLKFVLGLPKWEFSTGKNQFTLGKNQEKWLCPLWKIFLLPPAQKTQTIGYRYKFFPMDYLPQSWNSILYYIFGCITIIVESVKLDRIWR